MARARWGLLAAIVVGIGCGGNQARTSTTTPPPVVALTPAEIARPWVALSLPRPEQGESHVARGPDGFVVLVAERPGRGGKIIVPTNNYLYRSDDGIGWHRLPMPAMPSSPGLRSLAYGGGRYVMGGASSGSSELWTSSDLSQWSKYSLKMDGSGLSAVKWVNGLFFALSTFRDFLVSNDGLSWTLVPSLTLQQTDVAFGNGLFVLVGSGPIRTSRDGRTWDDRPLDCTLPGGCITDPSGGVHQGYHAHVVFAPDSTGGRFYVDRLTSTDGITWQAHDAPVTATAQADGYLFGSIADDHLFAWRPGQAPTEIKLEAAAWGPPLSGGVGPETITTPTPGGETCLTNRCVVVGEALYLIR